jgi:hypothetical protein
MGLISGVFMGMIFGIALMAGWKQMMRYRSTKRIAKVCQNYENSDHPKLNFVPICCYRIPLFVCL